MESTTIATNMVIGIMNAKRIENLRASIINARNKDTRHQNAKPRHSIQQNKLLKQYLFGTTIPGGDVITMENLDTFAQIVLNII